MTPILDLAKAFFVELRKDIGAGNLAKALSLNETVHANTNICSTHDYCDANMCMDSAFTATFGREVDLESSADIELIDEAWRHATKPRQGEEIILGDSQ